ncbi:MAG: DUF4105 domain-containing protein [Pseudomonadales bacterium]|nr:DUF4105 domain-containing protein [Pseudomonadales bacterium]
MLKKRPFYIIIGLILLLFILSFFTPKASNNKDWSTPFKQLPIASVNGDILSIKNQRDFRYSANQDDSGDNILQARYIHRDYKLSDLKQLWYGISHFGPYGLAHVFVSFEFAKNQFLVVSIEARLEQEQQGGYNPILGLFRHYQKTVVLATEEDVIGLRSHLRQEKVYLYPLQLSTIQLRTLLFNYLRLNEDLQQHPVFYNSFTDNCMTGLLRATSRLNQWWQWLDYRIILPGFSDRLLYEKMLSNNTISFKAWQDKHLINPAFSNIESPSFSSAIRTTIKD